MTRHIYWLVLPLILITLSACNLTGGGDDPTDPTTDPIQGGGATDPAAIPTETPTAFKSELVICGSVAPTTFYPFTESLADPVLALTSPPAAVFGTDYTAEPGTLVSLPSLADGTISRNEDGTLSVRLHFKPDYIWSDGQPFEIVADPLRGLSLIPAWHTPAFDVIDAHPGDASIAVTVDYAEYPYVPTRPPIPSHLYGTGFAPENFSDPNDDLLLTTTLGPYMLSDRGADGSIRLIANPHYPGAESLIPVVSFRYTDPANLLAEFSAGTCDLILGDELSPASLTGGDPIIGKTYTRPGPVYERVVFNTYNDAFSGRVPYFADVRVRQAFGHAINRALIAETATGGLSPVRQSYLPEDHWAYPQDGSLTFTEYDLAGAMALLEAAGWRDTDGDGIREYQGSGGEYSCQRGEWFIETGTPLAPSIVYPSGDPVRQAAIDQMTADLAAIGVQLIAQPIDPTALFTTTGAIQTRSFDAAFFAGVNHPDPGGISEWVGADVYRHPLELSVVHRWDLADRWLTSEQLVETLAYDNIPAAHNDFTGQNYSGWCDESANIAIVEANLALDVATMQNFYTQHQTIFTQQLPVLPLYARPRIFVAANYLCGVEPGPVDPVTWNIAEWWFDESGFCGG